jgi:hypothetical protein
MTDMQLIAKHPDKRRPIPAVAELFRSRIEEAATSRREALEQLEARPAAELGNPEVQRWYKDFERDSFVWLTSDEPAPRDLTEDVIDTLRCLRSADALRQRGTTLKTSAGYEVFVSESSASSIYALRSADTSELYMIEGDQPLNAGEANMVSSELTHEDDLRVAFHRGRFPDDKTIRRAANNAALVINDIQADVIGSFRRPASFPSQRTPCVKTDQQMQGLVEHTEDNAGFASLVCEALEAINPGLGSSSRPVPSLLHVRAEERMRYLAAEPFAGDVKDRRRLGEQLASCGLRVDPTVDVDAAFMDVRVIELKAGDVLLEGGSRAAFVCEPARARLADHAARRLPRRRLAAWSRGRRDQRHSRRRAQCNGDGRVQPEADRDPQRGVPCLLARNLYSGRADAPAPDDLARRGRASGCSMRTKSLAHRHFPSEPRGARRAPWWMSGI